MSKPAPPRNRPEPARDFRDQAVQEALDRVVGPYRPERRLRARIVRVAVIAAIALAAAAGFWTMLYYSSPKHAAKAPERKAIPIQLLPAPKAP